MPYAIAIISASGVDLAVDASLRLCHIAGNEHEPVPMCTTSPDVLWAVNGQAAKSASVYMRSSHGASREHDACIVKPRV